MSERVVIVGAGVIGLSVAYYCAQRGYRVTVVERNSPQRDGCSFGNAGMIVPSHFVPLAAPGMIALGLKWMWRPTSPFYIKPRLDLELLSWAFKFWRASNAAHVKRAAPLLRDLSLASRAAFEELATKPDADFALVKRGLLMLCQSQHALDEEAKAAEQARALGIPASVLNAQEAAKLDPAVQMAIAGAVHYPLDCHLAPNRFMAFLQRQTESLGVQFLWQSEVQQWTTNGHQQVRGLKTTKGESIEGDEFVLCGGSWAPKLAGKLGLRLPMQAGKGYSLTLAKPRHLPELCSICTEARLAVTPMAGALRVGGTMEMAGLSEEISLRRVRQIVTSFCRYFPEFTTADFDGIQPWRGLRPCSPDGLPYLGRTARFSNLLVAAGHAMMGLSLGPITGKLVAGILGGDPAPWDLEMLSPDRYGCRIASGDLRYSI